MINKETYFDVDSIQVQSDCLLEEVRKRIEIQSMELNLDRAALLVLDMQRYFIESNSHAFVPSAPAIIPNIIRLQRLFLDYGCPVVQTRHLNNKKNAGMMKKWWKDLIGPKNPLSGISKELRDPRIDQIKKIRYDAFYKTGLEEMLRKRKINQLVIAGVMTHLCCETTARSAFIRDFEVFFTVDATATYNLDLHRASLLNLAHGFSDLRLSCDIMDAFKTHGKK